jgi:hypothetical protein
MFRAAVLATIWLALTANSIVIAGPKEAAGRRVALIIGNSNYENAGRLPNPRNDAEAMAAALERLGFEVELALNVTQPELAEPVRQFSRRLQEPTWRFSSMPGMVSASRARITSSPSTHLPRM